MTHLLRLMFAALLVVTPCVFSGCESETVDNVDTTTPEVVDGDATTPADAPVDVDVDADADGDAEVVEEVE